MPDDFSEFERPEIQSPAMQKVEHIGIAVKTLASAVPLFEKLLNTPCYKTEMVETEKVNTAFFKQGETNLLARLADDPRVDREIAELCERASHRLDLALQDKHHVPRP